MDRARREADRLVTGYETTGMAEEIKAALTERMATEATKFGMERLPGQGIEN